LFLSAFCEDEDEVFGVVGHVERVAFQSGFEGIAEPVDSGWVGDDGLDFAVAVAVYGGPL
jgi:hypothetical protein